MFELRSLALANVSAPFHRLVAHAPPWRAERSAESQQLLGRLREFGMRRDGSGRYMPVSNGAPITADATGTNPVRLTERSAANGRIR